MKPSSPPLEQTSLFHQACTCGVWRAHGCPIHDPQPVGTTTTATTGTLQTFSASASRIVDPESVSESIERVFDNASEQWKIQAEQIVYRLCQTRHSFDLDDVAEALKPIDHLPHEPRSVGQLMRNVVRNEWCERSGVRNSKRKSRHYGYIAIYESLIFSAV